MTAAGTLARPARLTGGLARLAMTLLLGALAATTPVTSVIALGWLTRRMGAAIADRFGQAAPAPGWVLGPRGRGRIVRALGGLAQNISAGVGTLAGLALWTMPFAALWLIAWWAGWENSFGKGYEQAAVGPAVFLAATALSLPVIAALPFALAHAAAEGRWTAMAEPRRIRAVTVFAGARMPLIAVATLFAALPILGLRALPVAAPDLFGTVEDMTPEAVASLRSTLDLAGAAWSFASLLVLRLAAARAYAVAAPRAAAADPALWAGTRAALVARAGRRPVRAVRAAWFLLSLAFAFGLFVTVFLGQFMSYAWWRWLTEPAWLLPWPG